MVCPNCHHELNPQARVCPACGTPVSGALPIPTVTVTPPAAQVPPPPAAPRKKKKVTAARVFTVILLLLAVVMNGALVAFWFWPSITVTGGAADASASSVTLISMYEICRSNAPYLSIVVCVLCAVSAIFCLVPLFKKQASKRKTLLIPKIATVLCAVCYAVPYLVASIAYRVQAALNGGDVYHNNPYTTICFWLFVVLCVASELTIVHRNIINQRKIDDLKAQLTEHGITPEEW